VVINQSLDLHKLSASIIENKAEFDHLSTLEKIKLDNFNDVEENKSKIAQLMKDLDQIHHNDFTITKTFNAIENDISEVKAETPVATANTTQ